MRTLLAGALALTFLALHAQEARGQIALGPQVSVAEDMDLGVGVAVAAPLAAVHRSLEFSGSFTLFFPDGVDYLEVDGDLRYFISGDGESSFLPYALAGLAIGRFSWDEGGPGDGSETKLALRLGAGIQLPMDRFIPFAELGLGVGDLPDYTLRAGLTFAVGN